MTREELIALLGSWQDFFPLPATWTGELQRRAAPRGPAPSELVECGRCEGRGTLRGGWGCSACEGRGVYHVDSYTGRPVNTTEASWAELLGATVNCSTCGGWGRLGAYAEARPDLSAPLCAECEGTGKVPALLTTLDEGEPRRRQGDRTLDALADQDARRDRMRCYQQLAFAMGALHRARPGLHFLVCWVYVVEAQRSSPANEAALEEGLAFLLGALAHVQAPALIRRQAEAREAALVAAKGRGADTKAQDLRNAEIRRRRAAGETVTAIGAAYGLDKGQVSRIVNGKPRCSS